MSDNMEEIIPDEDIYDLFTAHAKWVLPRLKAFKTADKGAPSSLLSHEISEAAQIWQDNLQKMINAFEYVVENEEGSDNKDVEEGLDLFRKYYFALWI